MTTPSTRSALLWAALCLVAPPRTARADEADLLQQISDLKRQVEGLKRKVARCQCSSVSSDPALNMATPEKLITAYLCGTNLDEQLPYVVAPAKTRPAMVDRYDGKFPAAEEFAVLGVQPAEGQGQGRVFVSARVNKSAEPTRYLLQKASEGYRVDWVGTVADWDARAEEARLRKYGVTGAVLHAKAGALVRWAREGSEVPIELDNPMKAPLRVVLLVKFFDATGHLLCKGQAIWQDLPAGETRAESAACANHRPQQISSSAMSLVEATLQTGDDPLDVTEAVKLAPDK